MRENTDQKNSEYGHFSRSDYMALCQFFQMKICFKQFWKLVIISFSPYPNPLFNFIPKKPKSPA